MNKGQKLYKKAKKLIPGGTMLLSKRPEMFLPEKWPSYFSKAKGCKVWDLDGRELIDMCIMGIGTNTLGYGHIQVDKAVENTIKKGNMSTLNCPEEVYLAEDLIEIVFCPIKIEFKIIYIQNTLKIINAKFLKSSNFLDDIFINK